MWRCQDLGQRPLQDVRSPHSLNEEGHGVCLGHGQKASMEDLKQAIVTAPCLQLIDYHTDRCVILAVDSSALPLVSFSPLGVDDKPIPSHFGSITWNE